MREIEYRAWHIGREEYMDLEHCVIQFFDHGMFRIYITHGGQLQQIANDKSVELEWYTGVKDKHGKKVYEEDRITDANGFTHVVSHGFIAVDSATAIGFYMSGLTSEFEVVGTSHNDPARELFTTG